MEKEVITMVPSLLLANKQINREGTPILYRTNTFHLMSDSTFTVFLCQLRPATLQFVERIGIEDNFGTYFWHHAFEMSTVADYPQGSLMKRALHVTAIRNVVMRYSMRESMPCLFEWLIWFEHGSYERRVVITKLLRNGVSSREQLETMKEEFLAEVAEKL